MLIALTARERKLLACVAEGLIDKQIARRMGLSVHTVNIYLSALYRHLELDPNRNLRVQAALLAHCSDCLLARCHREGRHPTWDMKVPA